MSTDTGVRPLEFAPGQFIAATFRLPDTKGGRVVLKFDMGEGHASIHASSPSATADWLEHIASQLRAASADTATVHPISKAA